MELISTDLGNLSGENAKYLISQGVLIYIKDEGVFIKDNPFRIGDLNTQVYSMYRWVYEDIEKTLNLNDANKIVTVMREGQGNDYPRVQSITGYGSRLYEQKQAEKLAEKKTKTHI